MNILVLFGGRSVEHEISIISAFQVIETLRIKYNVIPVYISKNNEFYYDKKMKDANYFRNCKLKKSNRVKFINNGDKYYIKAKRKIYFDMIFPIVHGKGCEDGSIVNYFRFRKFPIVGTSSCFYSVAQDKYMTKRVLDGLNIDNVKYKLIERGEEYFKDDFEYPCIVKPNCLGSSLSISVANNFIELERAISETFKVDDSVIVENYLSDSKEYNVSVLNNNGKIEVSDIEQVKKGKIFSYEEKYLSNGKKKGLASEDREVVKEKIDKKIRNEIVKTAKNIYKNFRASGVIRIDFLYKDKLYVNEINAIPGSYAYYLWDNKYDFLELLDIVIKEAKRDNFFFYKDNELINKNNIFSISSLI